MPPRQRASDEKPAEMTWTGTLERGEEIERWARDAAMLPYAQVSALTGDDSKVVYQLRIKTQLDNNQGDYWAIVPVGAVVLFGGTEIDPEFSYREARKAQAQTFQEQP